MQGQYLEELNQLVGKPSKIKTVSSLNSFNVFPSLNQKEDSPEEIDISRQSTEHTFSEPTSQQCSPFKHTIDIDPQQCEQYTEQIFKYLLNNEKQNLPNPQYIKYQVELKEKMREFLVDWIIELHQKFKFQNETLYLAVNLLDRYLSVQQVSKRKFQLIGVTALMIASKYEEIYPPEIKDFLLATKNQYNFNDIVSCERDILNKLQFKVTVPYSYTFLQKFWQISKVDIRSQLLMLYYLELTLLNYSMLKFNPSLIASSAYYLSQLAQNAVYSWPLALQQIIRLDENDLMPCISEMQALSRKIERSSYVKRKFSSEEMNQVAMIEEK